MPPTPNNSTVPPSASYGCTQTCQCRVAITPLKKPDQPIAAPVGAGLPHEEVPGGSTH